MNHPLKESISGFYTAKNRTFLFFSVFMVSALIGCAGIPQVPVTWDRETVDLMPKELAIEYLNTVHWNPVWGRECCRFYENGVAHFTAWGKSVITPYSKLSMWTSGPWPKGTYQIGLSFPDVNALYIVPPGKQVPPAEATQIITALEVLLSTRTRK